MPTQLKDFALSSSLGIEKSHLNNNWTDNYSELEQQTLQVMTTKGSDTFFTELSNLSNFETFYFRQQTEHTSLQAYMLCYFLLYGCAKSLPQVSEFTMSFSNIFNAQQAPCFHLLYLIECFKQSRYLKSLQVEVPSLQFAVPDEYQYPEGFLSNLEVLQLQSHINSKVSENVETEFYKAVGRTGLKVIMLQGVSLAYMDILGDYKNFQNVTEITVDLDNLGEDSVIRFMKKVLRKEKLYSLKITGKGDSLRAPRELLEDMQSKYRKSLRFVTLKYSMVYFLDRFTSKLVRVRHDE